MGLSSLNSQSHLILTIITNVSQLASDNQEANQFDSKTSTLNHKPVHFRSRHNRAFLALAHSIRLDIVVPLSLRPPGIHLDEYLLNIIFVCILFGHNGKHYYF